MSNTWVQQQDHIDSVGIDHKKSAWESADWKLFLSAVNPSSHMENFTIQSTGVSKEGVDVFGKKHFVYANLT